MVNLVNYESSEDYIDLFFEYPEMVTLEIYINKVKILSIEKIKFFVYKILKGLEILHQYNIYHGQLNLMNILIFKNG